MLLVMILISTILIELLSFCTHLWFSVATYILLNMVCRMRMWTVFNCNCVVKVLHEACNALIIIA